MRERNYGIDIARLTCMFMVVLLHNLNQGGLLDWTFSSPRSFAYITLENYARVAVNVFALISGYLSSGRPITFKRAVGLWGCAFFWSGSLALVGLAGGRAEPGVWTVRAFFPLLGNLYWYLSAFFLLQILICFVGPGVERLGAKGTARLSVLLATACSVMAFTNEQGIGNGYTAFWLLVLWLLGRSIRLNQASIKQLFPTPRLIVASVILPLCVTWLEWHDATTGSDPSRWLSYLAPTCIIQSLCFFELLTRIRIHNSRAQKLLATLSPSAFGVYIIDTGNWFYGIWLAGRFAWVMDIPMRYGIPFILATSLAMFVVFLLLEALRLRIFAAARKLAKR